MKQSKAVVMKVAGKKTIVYTKKGDFLEIPTPKDPPRVGQVIEVSPKPARFPLKQSLYRYTAVAAILVLVLALGILNPLLGPNVAVANVSLEINSGLELYVDKDTKIIQVAGASGPLEGILEDLKLEGLDLYQAVNLILKEARAKNVLLEDNNFVLASVIPIDDKGQKTVDETKLRDTIREAMVSKNISGVVMVEKTDQATKRKAEQMGLSVNRYLVYEHCQRDGVQIHADELRQGDLQQVLTKKNVSLPNHFPDDYFEVKHGDHSGQPSNGLNRKPSGSNHRSDSEHGNPQHVSAPTPNQNATDQGSGHNGSVNYYGRQESIKKQHGTSGLQEHKSTPAQIPNLSPTPSNIEDKQEGLSHESQNNHD